MYSFVFVNKKCLRENWKQIQQELKLSDEQGITKIRINPLVIITKPTSVLCVQYVQLFFLKPEAGKENSFQLKSSNAGDQV